MNLRQPYEQLIADKLRKLSAPDPDASWLQMKRLLDEDEDTRPGGRKRPPGGWWRLGIIAIVLLSGFWLYIKKTGPEETAITAAGKQPTVVAESPASNNSNASNKTKITTIDNNTTLKENTTAASLNNDNKHAPVNATVAAGINRDRPANNNNTTSVVSAGSATAKNKVQKEKAAGTAYFLHPGNPGSHNSNNNKKQLTKDPSLLTGNGIPEKEAIAKKNNTGNSFVNDPAASESGKNTADQRTTIHSPAVQNLQNKTRKGIPTGKNLPGNYASGAGSYLPVNQPLDVQENWLNWLNGLKIPAVAPSANTSLLTADSIENRRNTATLLNNDTKKAVAKAQRDKDLEDMTRKEKKGLHLDLSNLFKPFSLRTDPEPRWAAGIAFSSSIPLNAQSRFNYTMNAKSGVLTDYIPSLYLQFHLNDYVYAQTELNFVSPQYTPQLLVYQHNDATAQAATSLQKSIYIQKLYYFSLPVSIHYSPINNLYFSAGLQFSSFQSGLANIEQREYATASSPDHPTSISNTVLKFKDDSIAAKLAPNEWRWQAGAEYYWNRFTIGLRYNQSLKKLFVADPSASLPNGSLRNESMIFFMRYNLFESRKKGK